MTREPIRVTLPQSPFAELVAAQTRLTATVERLEQVIAELTEQRDRARAALREIAALAIDGRGPS